MDTFAFTFAWTHSFAWTWTWAWAWAWARWAPPAPALRACTSYICTRASQGAGGRLQCALRRGQPARLPPRGHGRLQPRQVLRAAPRPHHGPRQQPGRRRRAAGSALQRPPLWRAPRRMHAMHTPCRAGWRGRPSCPYAALWCPYAAARRPPRDHCTLSCPSPCPLQEISRAYGPDACKLLPINSRGAGAPPLPDLWTGARPPEFSPTADAPPPPAEELGALLSDADMEQARTPTPAPTPAPAPTPTPTPGRHGAGAQVGGGASRQARARPPAATRRADQCDGQGQPPGCQEHGAFRPWRARREGAYILHAWRLVRAWCACMVHAWLCA